MLCTLRTKPYVQNYFSFSFTYTFTLVYKKQYPLLLLKPYVEATVFGVGMNVGCDDCNNDGRTSPGSGSAIAMERGVASTVRVCHISSVQGFPAFEHIRPLNQNNKSKMTESPEEKIEARGLPLRGFRKLATHAPQNHVSFYFKKSVSPMGS